MNITIPEGKSCTKCKQHKLLVDFHRHSASADGLKPLCKKCNCLSVKTYVSANRESVSNYQRDYRQSNATRLKECSRRRYAENRTQILEKTREYQKSNRLKLRKRNSKYRENNRAKVQKYHRDWQRSKRRDDPLFKLITTLRHRTNSALKSKGFRKTSTTNELLGAPLEVVKAHIESMFSKGMFWENHGDWHIDHIVPLSSAETAEDVMRLFNYKNLQPLWAADNLMKGSKI